MGCFQREILCDSCDRAKTVTSLCSRSGFECLTRGWAMLEQTKICKMEVELSLGFGKVQA